MLRLREWGRSPAQPLPLSSLSGHLASSRSLDPLDYPNRRHVRQSRWCHCCLKRLSAAQHPDRSAYQLDSQCEPVYGLAFQCEHDDFLLCQPCYDSGQAQHKHRSSHQFTKFWPLPPVERRNDAQQPQPSSSSSFSSLPSSPPLMQQLSFDSYEGVVYRDEDDVLVYYHKDNERGGLDERQPDPLQQSYAAILQLLLRQRAEADTPVTANMPRWDDGALPAAQVAHAPTLDIIGYGYLAALSCIQRQQASSASAGGLRLVLASYDCGVPLDRDWIPVSAQWLPGMLMLHPALPRKGHAELQRRNVLWPACYQPAAQQRLADFLSRRPFLNTQPRWLDTQIVWEQQGTGWLQAPLFDRHLLYPSLDELIAWLHQSCSNAFDLPAVLQLAEPYRQPFHWLCAGC